VLWPRIELLGSIGEDFYDWESAQIAACLSGVTTAGCFGFPLPQDVPATRWFSLSVARGSPGFLDVPRFPPPFLTLRGSFDLYLLSSSPPSCFFPEIPPYSRGRQEDVSSEDFPFSSLWTRWRNSASFFFPLPRCPYG